MFRFSFMEIGVLSFLLSIITVIALIDILRNEFKGNNKIIWLLVVVVFPVLGPVFYYFIGKKQKINSTHLNG